MKKRTHEASDSNRPQKTRLLAQVNNGEARDYKMHLSTPPIKARKRPSEECVVVRVKEDACERMNVFKFHVLLPNGTSVELKMSEQRKELPIEQFIGIVKKEYYLLINQKMSLGQKRRINWEYEDLYFTDAHGIKIRIKIDFREFVPSEYNLLWLHDGSAEADEYEDMWDLTPDTDLLKEIPDDYTCETALADLIDNSLQALWSNGTGEKRLISVEMHPGKISIFDSGPGMDGASGSIVKWGKMGASVHRSMREKAIGGEPPYLMPFFGMFGYGGPVATMCLGRRAVVSSKTKRSNKVFTLHMEREALVSASHSENCWKTKGGVRDPSEDEKVDSPHGSFTKVDIFDPKPKVKRLHTKQLLFRLKDIYFPYIQCDEVSGKTSRPIEFKVNGVDLAEIQGGEVATTNLHSCNGPEFIVQLHFSSSPGSVDARNQKLPMKANARLKCIYFPVVEGKESINMILEKLHEDGCDIRESFESFSRVSVRRLGRLLPDARWALLPFMEPKLNRGEKGQIFKRLCSRVKCFIDADSGFNPTPQKTDLAHHHPYTKALKNFGNRSHENEGEVRVEITRDGKRLSLTQLQDLYHDWVSEMHDRHDMETDGGLDKPTIVVVSSKIRKLDPSSGVLRFHKEIHRKGRCWKAGQNIKVLKGACTGCHKNNVYATLEYIIFEGLPGDPGEGQLICRPIGLREERGCSLSVGEGNTTVDINDSYVFPIRIIDSEKCTPVDDIEWGKKLDFFNQKLPAAIHLLSLADCQELDIDGDLPSSLEAGDAPAENIVAVIRPKSFDSDKCSKRLDQKFIVRENHNMCLAIKHRVSEEDAGEGEYVYSARQLAQTQNGLHGLYIFPVRWFMLLQKPGIYMFSFSLAELKDIQFQHVVRVEPSSGVCSWKVINHSKDELYTVRVGSCFKPLSIACIDRYKNRIPFTNVPELVIKLSSDGKFLARVRNKKVVITSDKLTMIIKDLYINSSDLDAIRPNYKAMLHISTPDEGFSVDFPCRVIPGAPRKISIHPNKIQKQLLPGQILEELTLEVCDQYGNHVKAGESLLLRLDGFSFQDGSGKIRDLGIDCQKKVDANSHIDLSDSLKVSSGYGKKVMLSVISKDAVIFELIFHTERRELRPVQKTFKNCEAGSMLKNIAFEIIDSEGKVDATIHDEEKYEQFHTLEIKSKSFCIDDAVRYSFHHGRCTIPSIPIPNKEGIFCFSVSHSRYPDLKSTIEVYVQKNSRASHYNARNVGCPKALARSSSENKQIPESGSSLGVTSPQVPQKISSVLSPLKVCLEKNQQVNPDSITNYEDIGTPILSREYEPILLDSPSPKETPVGNESFSPCSSQKFLLPISDTPAFMTPKSDCTNAQTVMSDLGKFSCSAFISPEKLTDDLANSALKKSKHEENLNRLRISQREIQQEVSRLQALIGPDLGNTSSLCTQQSTLEQINTRSQSAAAVICTMLEEERRRLDIMGVVALMGTVDSIELSRILAQYLGEDQMLAIVCRNYAAAHSLETDIIHKFASKNGLYVKGGYLAFCIDDISEPRFDPEDLLPLQIPAMPNGNALRGFVGYAVNLISIESSYLQWRTKSGHGLREALFYRLFSDLLVFNDRDCMMAARSCIKTGAVSLDGGMIKGNGLLSQGYWEPQIMFPVMMSKVLSSDNLRIMLTLEERMSELEKIEQFTVEELDAYRRWNEQFETCLVMYKRCMSE